jgi:hypothetical protein
VAEFDSLPGYCQCRNRAMPGIEADEAAEIRTRRGGPASSLAEKTVDGFADLQDLPERCAGEAQPRSGEAPPHVKIGKGPQAVLAPVGAIAVNDGIGEIECRQAIDEMMIPPGEGNGVPERFDRAGFRFHSNQQS